MTVLELYAVFMAVLELKTSSEKKIITLVMWNIVSWTTPPRFTQTQLPHLWTIIFQYEEDWPQVMWSFDYLWSAHMVCGAPTTLAVKG